MSFARAGPTFIHTRPFDEDWAEAGLDDSDLARLERMLIADPHAGDVMAGTGGLRKVRFPLPGRGKSGSVRVCYASFGRHFLFLMVAAFGKSRKANLSNAEKNAVAKMLREFERHLPPPRPRPAGNGG